MTETGLTLPEHLPYKQWEAIGPQFKRVHSSVQWCIGDWILYGERRYGEMYSQALNDLDYTYDYLKQVVHVCKTYEKLLRSNLLTFSHHREALSLPAEDRQAALRAAEKAHLSVAEFKEWIAETRPSRSGGARLPTGPKDDKKKDEDENAITVVIEKNEQAAVVQAASVVGKTSISSFLKGIADGTLKVTPSRSDIEWPPDTEEGPPPTPEDDLQREPWDTPPDPDDEQAEATAPSEGAVDVPADEENPFEEEAKALMDGFWVQSLSPAARACLPDLADYFKTEDVVDVVSQAVLGYYQIRKQRMKTFKERNPE